MQAARRVHVHGSQAEGALDGPLCDADALDSGQWYGDELPRQHAFPDGDDVVGDRDADA